MERQSQAISSIAKTQRFQNITPASQSSAINDQDG